MSKIVYLPLHFLPRGLNVLHPDPSGQEISDPNPDHTGQVITNPDPNPHKFRIRSDPDQDPQHCNELLSMPTISSISESTADPYFRPKARFLVAIGISQL